MRRPTVVCLVLSWVAAALKLPVLHRLPQEGDVGVVERIEGAEEDADAALGRDHRADVRQQADTEEQPAQDEAEEQENFAGTRDARRAQGRQDDVHQQADQRVAVGVADAARHEIAAEILGPLGGERGDERRAGEAADRRDPCLIERPSP